MSKWIHCKHCGHEYRNTLKRCPKCQSLTPVRFKTLLGGLLSVAVAVAVIVGLILGFTEKSDPNGSSSDLAALSPSVQSGFQSSLNSPSTVSNSSSSKQEDDPVGPQPTASQYPQPTDRDGNIKVLSDGTVQITIPQWLLLLVEPDFNYQLTEQEKTEYKFTGITKNSDGSATYSVGYNDAARYRLILGSQINGSISGLKKLSTVTKVEFTQHEYGTVKIYTTHRDAAQLQGDQPLLTNTLAIGISATVYQYFHMGQSVGCTLQFYNADGALIATSPYPALLQ